MINRLFKISITILFVYFLPLLILSLSGCDSYNNTNAMQLKTGDILFRGVSNQELSSAINSVTQTQKHTSFSHMGIVEKVKDAIYIIHAAPKDGVSKVTLNKFLSPNDSISRAVSVYRLNDSLKNSITTAIKKANTLIGSKYDYTYIMENKGYYCSEFIYEIFSADSIFQLSPMTFKNPNTNTFIDAWVEHYKKLGIPIPEGKPGCNPNGMATNKNLIYVGKL